MRYLKKIILFFLFFIPALSQSQDMDKIDSLTAYLKAAPDDTSRVNATLELCKEYQVPKPQLSYQYGLKAYHESKRIKWDAGTVKVIKRLGSVLVNQGKSDSTILVLDEGLALAEKINEKNVSTMWLNKGTAYNNKGDYEKALDCYFRALEIAKNTGQGRFLASAYNSIGKTYHDISQYEKAISYHMKSYHVADSIHEEETKAVTLSNLAIIYFETNDYEKAKEYYIEQLAIFRKLGFKKNSASILNNIGNVFFKQNKLDSALVYYNEALRIGKEIGDRYGIGARLENIGSAYYTLGDNQKGIYYLSESLKIREEIGDKRGMTQCYNNLSECYVKIHNYDKAIALAEKGLNLSKEINAPEQIIHAYQVFSIIYSAKQDFKNAFYYKELQAGMKDSINLAESKSKVAEMQVKFDSEKKESENKLLQQQNQIQALTISNNRYLLMGLVALMVLLIVVAILIFRQNKARSQQRAMQMEQKMLRSQMNPHFIFNSLVAIESYIYKNEPKEAGKYLSGFARLMRLILENSREEYVPLSKEIQTLEYYLQLQKNRFEDAFEYSITLGESTDADAVAIPPMLAQPFIENSIEHGLKNSNNKGDIRIRFSFEKDRLLFEVTDNGIGLERSKTLNEQNRVHRSMATTITMERLAILNRGKRKKISFDIGEIRDTAGNVSGTRVSFEIPFVEI